MNHKNNVLLVFFTTAEKERSYSMKT